jgi:hypothetical protein
MLKVDAPLQAYELLRDGFGCLSRLVNDEAARSLDSVIEDAITVRGSRRQNSPGSTYALRNLLDLDAVRSWAASEDMLSIVRPLAGERARPVRGLFFDKTADANWKVAWHQDRSIALRERHDLAGFGPWSNKAGVVTCSRRRRSLSGWSRFACTWTIAMRTMDHCASCRDRMRMGFCRTRMCCGCHASAARWRVSSRAAARC